MLYLLFIARTAVNPHSNKYEFANCIIALLCFFFILCDYFAQTPNIHLYIFIGNFNFKELSEQTPTEKNLENGLCNGYDFSTESISYSVNI